MMERLQRELVYITYYIELSLRNILFYYILGVLIGSFVSCFLKERIQRLVLKIPQNGGFRFINISIASILGIISPLCLYGTLPVARSLKEGGVKDDVISSFVVSSILLNPQLAFYSLSLGLDIAIARTLLTFIAGLLAGYIFKNDFFSFDAFKKRESHDNAANPFIRYIKNVGRNFKATGLYFALGVVLSSLFQRYMPESLVSSLLGSDSHFAIILASAFGVPVYACGGAVIPLLQLWLYEGMSKASILAFMNTGQALKLTNISALKMALSVKNLILFILFIFAFSIISGYATDLFI